MISIETGQKKLIASETFLALEEKGTIVSFGNTGDVLKFIFDFVEEKEKKQDVRFITVDKKTLRIELVNWNNPLGTTLTSAVEIGTFQNHKLFILFNVRKSGGTGTIREITFSAYKGEEVKNGSN